MKQIKARICWRIRGHEGRGYPIPWRAAQDSAEKLNREHGPGTHWIEVVSSEFPETVSDQPFYKDCVVPEPDPFESK